jgi:hypothetical protein
MRLLPACVVFVCAGPALASPEAGRSTPITASYTEENLAKALVSMGEMAGIKILFDADFRDRRLTIAFDAEPFDAALAQVMRTNLLFAKPLGERTLVIVPDSPAKHSTYDRWAPTPPLPFVRNRSPISLSFTDASLKSVFEALGKAAGVKFLFDADYRDRRVSIRFDGEPLEAALDQLILPYRLFLTVIEGNAIVVAADSPAMRQRYGKASPPAGRASLGCDTPVPGLDAAFGGARGSVRARFADGPWVGVDARLSPPVARMPVHALFRGETRGPGRWLVERILGDRERTRYVGYQLEIQRTGTGPPFRVTVKSLPDGGWERLCHACPAGAQRSTIAQYPEPFELGSGGSFTLDLMENPSTGEKIIDQVTIVQPPSPARPARRFKVQLILQPEPDGLTAGLCIRDLESGAAVGGVPRFRLSPQADEFTYALDGTNRAGKPLHVSVRVATEDEGRTTVYSIETREGNEVVQYEETRLPATLT